MSKEIRERKKRKQLNKIARKSKGKTTKNIGITITNINPLTFDFKDMAILSVAMIPFFIALDCILGIKTLDFKVLTTMNYGLTLKPIISSFIIIPMVYCLYFYIRNKNNLNKKSFLRIMIEIGVVIIGLIVARKYLSSLVIFNIPSYSILAVFAVIIIVYYILKIKKVFSIRKAK